ncbi:MAG: ketoacyl-synthetase C-terminal extension domain-containing protein [Myxococcota bacterium]
MNSLGVGGTNAHVVLEEAPPTPTAAADPNEPVLLQLSAKGLRSLDGAASASPSICVPIRRSPSPTSDSASSARARRWIAGGFSSRAAATRRSTCSEPRPRRVFTHSLPRRGASVLSSRAAAAIAQA